MSDKPEPLERPGAGRYAGRLMESVYWVFTLKCNDLCGHCYNNSGPKGESIETEELLKVVPNLPARLGRLILSGGEPTVEMAKLEEITRAVRRRYRDATPIYLQSNGDLIDEKRLGKLLDMGIDRIDIVSIDRYHKNQGRHVERLRALFLRNGMTDARAPRTSADATSATSGRQFAFWGATEDLWLGGNWARGRALVNGLAKLDPGHNFCNRWSGALGFLDDETDRQEVHIQLYRLYPCCPTTYYSLGDVRTHSVAELLDRYRNLEPFRALNLGDVHSLGAEKGLTREYISGRIRELGDVCLWCDEYFARHYDGPKGEPRRAEG